MITKRQVTNKAIGFMSKAEVNHEMFPCLQDKGKYSRRSRFQIHGNFSQPELWLPRFTVGSAVALVKYLSELLCREVKHLKTNSCFEAVLKLVSPLKCNTT